MTFAVNILLIFPPEWKSVVKVVSASSHLAEQHGRGAKDLLKSLRQIGVNVF